MLAPFKKIDLEDHSTDKLQQNLDNFLRPIALNPLMDGVFLENIVLLNGAINHIAHGLQRAARGYIVCKRTINSNSAISSAKICLTATAPSGWLICDGSAISRKNYATLFAKIGTTYGVGDGVTTFNIPDFRQKFPLGKAPAGTGSVLGGTGGNIDHVHTGPSHTHGLTAAFAKLTFADSTDQIFIKEKIISSDYSKILNMAAFSVTTSSAAAGGAMEIGGTTDADGTQNTGTANPPFLAVNFIIQTDNFDVNSSVWDGESANTAKQSFLDLYSAANMTVSLWIF